ncbi:MAG: carbon storage regulator [Planctomycetales bacterium]|nr:carbon storage regulator [Planctomycetales bacterium]
MLVLTRKVGERIRVGESIDVVVTEIRGDKVRLGFEAPPEVKILREELIDDGERPAGEVPAAA